MAIQARTGDIRKCLSNFLDRTGFVHKHGDELRGLAKDVQVAEVADERVGEHVDQQAAEGRRRDGGHVLELFRGHLSLVIYCTDVAYYLP